MFKSLTRENLPFLLRRWGNIVFWVCLAVGLFNVLSFVSSTTISIRIINNFFKDLPGFLSSSVISLEQTIRLAISSLITLITWLISGIIVKLFSFSLAALLTEKVPEKAIDNESSVDIIPE